MTRPAPSRRRRLLFKLLAVVVPPLVILGGLEVGLRAGGYGEPTGFFVPADGSGAGGGQLLRENGAFGLRYFPRAIARRPIPVLLEEKGVGEPPLRVCVLGGSAAMGDPAFAGGMTRMLGVLMRANRPDREVEVVCAAMTAINSHVLLPIARDCVAVGADVLVVYVGNNEVVGPYGAGTVLGAFNASRSMIAWSQWARCTRTGQLIAAMARGEETLPDRWGGMEMFLGQQVRASDPRLADVHASYRANLEEIIDIATAGGARVVLANVATNLADCPPFASLHREDLSAAELTDWQDAWERALAAVADDDRVTALQALERAAALDTEHAELHYRIGRLRLDGGDHEGARESLTRARDLDTLRFRADSEMEAIVAAVAREHAGSGVEFVDAQAIATAASTRGVPGAETLHEHVHLNRHGNYLIACALLDAVETALGGQAPGAVLDEAEVAERLARTSWDELDTLRELRRRMSSPPYTNQAWHEQEMEALDVQIATLARTAESTMGQAEAIATYDRAIAGTPDDWILREGKSRLLQARGDYTRASDELRIVIELIPHHAEAHHMLAVNLYQLGMQAEALEEFERALELDADNALAHHNFGQCLLAMKRADDAIEHLEAAARLKPDLTAALTQLGFAHTTLGDLPAAVAAFQRAIDKEPENLRARANLAMAYEKLGQPLLAASTLDEAIRLARELGLEDAARQLEERRR